MAKNNQKSKMTIDKLAEVTQREFLDIKKGMVTKSYLDEKLENFATKDDLENFATKEDIKTLATKDDLKEFATKDDLENFATKDDLRGLKEEIDVRLTQMKDEIKEEITDEFREGTAKILQGVDKIVTRFDTAEKDHVADKLLHDRHEKRLEKLEAKIG